MRYILLLVLLLTSLAPNSYAQGISVNFSPSGRFFPGYGNVTVGKTKDQNITISNSANSTAALNCSITGPITTRFSIVGPASFSVAVGQTYMLTIRFQPDSLGLFRDTIYINHNADTTASLKNPIRYAFNGTGAAADTFPKISITPGGGFGTFLNFGNVTIGKTASMSFTIKNVSDTIRSLIGTVGNPTKTSYSIASGAGNFSLDTGKTSVVTINFTPDSAGQIFDSVIVTSNANSSNNRIRVFLAGTGVKPNPFPRITVTGGGFNGINFGYDTIGHSPRTATIMITNTSDSARTLTGNVISPNSPFSIISGGGNFTLDSGKSITVQLELNSLTSGTFKDSLLITSNSDSANQTKKIYLTGVAGAISGPHITVKPTLVNFGSVAMGASNSSIAVTIFNSGEIPSDLLLDTVAMPSLPFSITSGNGANSIPMNDSLHIVVQMATTQSGTFKDSIVITSNSNDNFKRFVVRLLGTVTTTGDVKDGKEITNFITAMPNPFSSKIVVSFSMTEPLPVKLKVYDMMGKEVFISPENIYSSGVQLIEWDAARFGSGAYLCVLTIGKETRSIRVIKN